MEDGEHDAGGVVDSVRKFRADRALADAVRPKFGVAIQLAEPILKRLCCVIVVGSCEVDDQG